MSLIERCRLTEEEKREAWGERDVLAALPAEIDAVQEAQLAKALWMVVDIEEGWACRQICKPLRRELEAAGLKRPK